MKKIAVFLSVLALSSCVNAGDNGWWKTRNTMVERLNGYDVRFYDDKSPELVKTEYVDEKNYKLNEKMTAFRGYSVVNNKIYRKDFYEQEYAKANKNGFMDSSSLPHKIKDGEIYKYIGEITVDGKVYRLVSTGFENFVLLVEKDGTIYERMGQVRNDSYVVLLNTEFYLKPEDVKLLPVKTSRTEQTKPLKGFDVKYNGVKLDRVWFTYLDYGASQDSGTFEDISFPNKSGLIEINGIGFRILHVDNDRIDYMVIKEDK